MSTLDFFRSRLDTMVDMRHPLAVLAQRLPWGRIEPALAAKLTHQERAAQRELSEDLLAQHVVEFGAGLSNAGRSRLSIRLMASLLYLKNRSGKSLKVSQENSQFDYRSHTVP